MDGQTRVPISLPTNMVGSTITNALRTGTLRPVFQPVLHLQTGELAGFEVLARWRHETFGPVPPSEFLPVIEQTGMLPEFTRHMVISACTAAAGWPGTFWLGFKVLATQVAGHDLPGLLIEAVQQTSFPPQRVVVEMTQEVFAADHDHACLVTDRLVEHGFRLALSDVGRATAMGPILSVPFSLLKIGRALVRAAPGREDVARGIAGLLGLAKGLDVPVVATGIETAAQADRLRDLGCALGQGWLFGEGLPDVLAGSMATSPRSVLPSFPKATEPNGATKAAAETACAAFAEMLDGMGLAFCLFDDDDRTTIWNRTFLDFFPEHRHHVSKGEPYRENLRRFYEARLHGEERQNIDRYITDGITRHRQQTRPFTFHHRGRRLRVASLPIPGGSRARVWQEERVSPKSEFGTKASRQTPPRVAGRYADGYAVLDEADRVVSANTEFLRLYDAVTQEEVIGLTLTDIVRRAWRRHSETDAEAIDTSPEIEFGDNMRFAGAPFEVKMPRNEWRRVLQHREPDGLGHSIHSDITALKREQEDLRATRETLQERNTELAMLAGTDGLTGVANRRRFGEKLAEAWTRTAADQTCVALLIIDVDNFKAVNDRVGHPGGDECLRQIANSIAGFVRSPNDLVARYGGEEFAVILPDADGAAALAVAERIRQGVALAQADTFKVTISIGCVSVQPGRSAIAGSTDLIEKADAALYWAKQRGRNRVETA